MTEQEYDDFIVKCTELIPPSYDDDESAESIILRYLKDMGELARTLAMITADYR